MDEISVIFVQKYVKIYRYGQNVAELKAIRP